VFYVFLVLRHDRRRLVHFNVTLHPTAQWAAQQVVEAFPFDDASRFLLRDRDGIYGQDFRDWVDTWESRKCSLPHGLHGKIHIANA
jgi:hypothetical protein